LDIQVPRVTVVMAAYNAGRFLRYAIDSILCQSFSDFEVLLIDDGSTDDTRAIVQSYRDARLRLLGNDRNRGVVYTRNRGLELADGAYVAPMDADDVAHHERLERQVAFLDSHPDIAMVGTWVNMIDEQGNPFLILRSPTDSQTIYETLLDYNTFFHSSVMFRKHAVLAVGGYRGSADLAQDWDLWLRLSEQYALANLDEVLLDYRVHGMQRSLRMLGAQRKYANLYRRQAADRRGVRKAIEPGMWTILRAGAGTAGADCLEWCTYVRMAGQRHLAASLARQALVRSPLARRSWGMAGRVVADSLLTSRQIDAIRWFKRKLTLLFSALGRKQRRRSKR
jgi:glycosyltransferase involved in cell wall biosynthesis